jgi:Ankyrin repeats (3 copies)
MGESLANTILFGQVEEVAQLIQAGADLETIDEYGFSPLIEAVIANKLEVASLLLQQGAAADSPDMTGRTPLHWAVDNNNLSLCRLLLEHRADPNAYTQSGQPLLIYPLLRDQTALKHLLYQYGAQLSFAQDFIQAKLLGHRYELSGEVDIVNTKGAFIPIEYEGFFLEFSLNIVRYSLQRYLRHFLARPFRKYFPYLIEILQAFRCAASLLSYQRYTIDIQAVSEQIDTLLNRPLLLLPIAYEGHAISLIKYHHFLVRCDRGENSQKEASIVIYKLTNLEAWTKDFVKQLLYQIQSREFVTQGIQTFLQLKPLLQLPLASQLIGNCSWANIEASVLAMLFLLQLAGKKTNAAIQTCHETSFRLYSHWLEWDKARALEECIKSFPYATKARKATKAALLGAVLFQTCRYQRANDLTQVTKLLPILSIKDYQYVLKSYLKVYWQDRKTPEGHNLMQLLDNMGLCIPS